MGPSITTGIAVYGAIVATLSLSWNIYVGLRDRTYLAVDAVPAALVLEGRAIRHLVYVTAMNRGRRTLTIAHYEIAFSSGARFIRQPFRRWPLPKELKEGEACTNNVVCGAPRLTRRHPRGRTRHTHNRR